jgi:deoxyribonuclease V
MLWPENELTLQEAARIQNEMRREIVLEDRLPDRIETIAGLDVSHSRFSSHVFAIAVLLAYPSMQALEEAWTEGEAIFPYQPGYLSFREAPFVREALHQLSRKPDLLFVDGQGIAHPRGCGIASHVAFLEDLPGIGCAKSVLYGKYGEVGPNQGDRAVLRGMMDGRMATLGYAVRTKLRSKPMILSPGHRISPETAANFALECVKGYRLPEPTRQAHEAANRIRREKESESASSDQLRLDL